MADARARAPRVNVAIAAAVVAMPLVVATGFLSGTLVTEPPAADPVSWPDLRGTIQPGAGSPDDGSARVTGAAARAGVAPGGSSTRGRARVGRERPAR